MWLELFRKHMTKNKFVVPQCGGSFMWRNKHSVMKRILMLTVGLMVLVFLSGCSSGGEQNIFGEYTLEEVSYLSPLSSSTKDYVNSQMEETKYTIKDDLFKIESTDYTVEFSSPKYVKEEISNESSVLSDVHTFIGSDVDYHSIPFMIKMETKQSGDYIFL